MGFEKGGVGLEPWHGRKARRRRHDPRRAIAQPMLPALFDYLKSQRDPMLQTLRRLVEQETPTDDKAAIDRAQEYLAGEFAALGGAVG